MDEWSIKKLFRIKGWFYRFLLVIVLTLKLSDIGNVDISCC